MRRRTGALGRGIRHVGRDPTISTNMLSQNEPPPIGEDASIALVVAAANGERKRVLDLLASGLPDPMIGGGLPILVAAATGQSVIKTLVSSGAYRKRPDVLRMASRIAMANQRVSDAIYLSFSKRGDAMGMLLKDMRLLKAAVHSC